MLRAVRSLHFYRKVPHDVTEATLAGGVMSVLAVLAMGTLAVQHISHFAEVALDTKVLGKLGIELPAEAGSESADSQLMASLKQFLIVPMIETVLIVFSVK